MADGPVSKRARVGKVALQPPPTTTMLRSAPIPVTLLSGFLGAGKTTLLKRILECHSHGMKIAVVVNDMGELNIDAKEIKQHKLIQEKAQMVELQNGCICCTLRGDLLKTVKELSEATAKGGQAPAYDYIVIESTGIAEPLPVAQTFVMDVNSGEHMDDAAADAADKGDGDDGDDNDEEDAGESGESEEFEPLSKYARLDTLVTVVDAFNVLRVLGDQDSLAERQRLLGHEDAEAVCATGNCPDQEEGEEQEEDSDTSSLSQLLLDQIEVADVILLSKADLVHPECARKRHGHLLQVRSLVQKLNPAARVLVPGYEFDFAAHTPADSDKEGPVGSLGASKFGGFDVAQVVDTHLFDLEKAQASAGWAQELEKDLHGAGHTPETEEYGIGSFVWRTNGADPRPFHPERLKAVLSGFGELLSPSESKPKDEDGREQAAGVFAGVVRSKGTLWLAYGHAVPVTIHTAGRQLEMEPNTEVSFLAAVPREQWSNEDHAQHAELLQLGHWHGGDEGGVAFGDRASELVCIGVRMTAERKQLIINALNGALLTADEMAVGIKAFKEAADGDEHPWKEFSDPFFGGTGAATCWGLEELDEEDEGGGESA